MKPSFTFPRPSLPQTQTLEWNDVEDVGSCCSHVSDATWGSGSSLRRISLTPLEGPLMEDVSRSAQLGQVLQHRQATSTVGIGVSYNIDLVRWSLDPSTVNELGKQAAESINNRCYSARCQKAAESNWFRAAFGFLLFFDIISTALYGDLVVLALMSPDSDIPEHSFLGFNRIAEHIFMVLFITEIIIRALACKDNPWLDRWWLFDTIIVGLTVLDLWIVGPLGDVLPLSALRVFRCARLLRAFKAGRVLRILRVIRPLRLATAALTEALLQTFWITCLLILISWAMAVVTVHTMHASDETPPLEDISSNQASVELDAFDGTGGAFMLLLSAAITKEIDWGPNIVEPLAFSGYGSFALSGYIVFFLIILSMGWLLLLVEGMFVNTFLEAARRDQLYHRRMTLTKGPGSLPALTKLFEEIDVNSAGAVTKQDFISGVEKHQDQFAKIGLKPCNAETFFRHTDFTDQGAISEEQFLMTVFSVAISSKSVGQFALTMQQEKLLRSLITTELYWNIDMERLCSNFTNTYGILGTESESFEDTMNRSKRQYSQSSEEDDHRVRHPTKQTEQLDPEEELERDFNVKARLAKIATSLQKIPRGSGPGAHGQQIASRWGNKCSGLWSMLYQDCMPSLHTRSALPSQGWQLSVGSLSPAKMESPREASALPSQGWQLPIGSLSPAKLESPREAAACVAANATQAAASSASAIGGAAATSDAAAAAAHPSLATMGSRQDLLQQEAVMVVPTFGSSKTDTTSRLADLPAELIAEQPARMGPTPGTLVMLPTRVLGRINPESPWAKGRET